MNELLLMTPGPTRVPERVLRAGARPMIHHRTPEFAKELATVLELLPPLFGTTQPTLPVHTTGRGALEATICNLFSPGDEIAACCNGKFGEMWAGFAESYGVIVHRIETDWEQSVNPATVDAFLAEHRRVKAVAMTYADSSTGVANDVAAVARIANARGVLTMVDGVSSIGGMPFELDAWGVDVAVTASQKCLMSSPGISFVAMSQRAWRASESARLPRNYWSFAAIRSEISKAKPETPGTTPVHLVLQVAEALRMIHEEGLTNVLLRHRLMAERMRKSLRHPDAERSEAEGPLCAEEESQSLLGSAGVLRRSAPQDDARGMSLQCPALVNRASTLTAITLPMGVAPGDVRAALKARGILTAAGLGPYQATAFRIGHMGDIRMSDVDRTLGALADVLSSQSASVA